MKNKKKLLLVIVLCLAFLSVGLNYYLKIFGKLTTESGIIFIKSTDNFNDLVKTISPFVNNIEDFTWVAEQKKFNRIKPGKYELKKGWSANDLVNLLRSGKQKPITVSFNNQDSLEKLAGRISAQIEADSISLLTAFLDPEFLTKQNLNNKTALEIYIPNSYEFYWNTSAKQFRARMLSEFDKFWNKSRLEKAKKLNLTKSEVITLASIVKKETSLKQERATVAGLYLNRIKRGIPLQADPTVIYTIKEKKGQDYDVKRVLYKDLEIKSPYNTYLNRGLPPSLIAMPDIFSIDAVLNPEKHNYIYMCANIESFGSHIFTSSISQHNKNAAKYQRWLSKQGIKR